MKKYIAILSVVTLFSPFIASASFDTNLKFGARGIDVTALQDLLANEDCLSVSPTGYFGFMTQRAVQCFQTKHELPSTGFFGPMSRGIANSIITQATTNANQAELNETGTTTMISDSQSQVKTQIQSILDQQQQIKDKIQDVANKVTSTSSSNSQASAIPVVPVVQPRIEVKVTHAVFYPDNAYVQPNKDIDSLTIQTANQNRADDNPAVNLEVYVFQSQTSDASRDINLHIDSDTPNGFMNPNGSSNGNILTTSADLNGTSNTCQQKKFCYPVNFSIKQTGTYYVTFSALGISKTVTINVVQAQ